MAVGEFVCYCGSMVPYGLKCNCRYALVDLLNIRKKENRMIIESWYKIWCANCNKPNWVCNGDESDVTTKDVDGFVCHNCGSKYSLGSSQFDDMDDYEVGLDNPKEG